MAKAPTIESVMTPYPFSVEIGSQIATAKTMMDQLAIRHLPVRDGERLAGVVSAAILAQAQKCSMDISVNSPLTVGDFCDRAVHVVPPEEPLEKVLRAMAEKRLDVTLVATDGHLVGIFTVTDACRAFADLIVRQR
jgi:acetoin utilization protein AcuB